MPLIRVAILTLLVGIASPAAWAQSYYQMGFTGSITFGNLTFTESGCSYQLNNGSGTNCNYDDLEVGVTVNNGAVTLTYVNSNNMSAALLSQASASGCTCVSWDITVTSTSKISGVMLATTGVDTTGSMLDNWIEVVGNPGTETQAYLTASGSASADYAPAAGTTSLNLNLNLGLNNAYQAGKLSLSSASITFVTPEPGSMAVFALGAGSLLILRRRQALGGQRQSRRTGPNGGHPVTAVVI